MSFSNDDPTVGQQTHRCFICLEDEAAASLPRDWATPCVCSLEGHQQCLLAWVADLEGRGKDIKCPLCLSPITTTERFDPVLYLGARLSQQFSRYSPKILVGFVGSSALLAGICYGGFALDVFAGPHATLRYISPKSQVKSIWGTFGARLIHMWQGDKVGFDLRRLLSLSLVGPALILNRIALSDLITIPASLWYAVSYGRHDEELPVWPPCPGRAMAVFPLVRAVYFHLYSSVDFRLRRKLDTVVVEAHEAQQGVFQPDGNVQVEQAVGEEPPNAIQNEVDPAPRNHRQHDFQVLADSFTVVIDTVTGALLWPVISYGMGSILQQALPRAWVTRPVLGPNTGLLQERWGRSMVGGCLFVVLKDVFTLYAKYRRGINRRYRRIRNAERSHR